MRLPVIAQDQMNDAQRAVAAAATAGKRGRIPRPALAWLHAPEFAMRTQHLGEYIRYDTIFPPALNEMAILVTARHWTSHFEWYAHRKLAEEAGLDPAIINAIRDRQDPMITDPDARVVYDYAHTLHTTRAVPQALHDALVAAWGPRGAVDLVGVCGYYTMVSMTLNAFDVTLPDGAVSELH